MSDIAVVTGASGALGRSVAYTVAKAGVVRLTSVLAAEFAELGINAVLASVVDTPANRETMSAQAMSAQALRAAVPTGDVAAVVDTLCSDAARTITGAAIPTYGTTS